MTSTSGRLSAQRFSEFGAELEARWRSLEAASDHFVFQSYDWLWSWQRTVGAAHGVEPCIITVNNQNGVVALFPFGLRRFFGVRVLEFLGGGQCDYNAPLLAPAAADEFATIWAAAERLLPHHDVRAFTRLPELLANAGNPSVPLWTARPAARAYAATLGGSWDDVLNRIPKRIRADSRRQLRKLHSMGAVTFAIATDSAEHDRLLDAMVEQKRRRYVETGVRDPMADPAILAFYRETRGSLGADGRVHLSALQVDNTIVATHWGALHRGRFYYLMPTYAAGQWRNLSVGRLLQERLMEWCVQAGVACFDFSVGDEPYKLDWSDTKMILYDANTARSPFGMAYLALARAERWAKTNPRSRAVLMAGLRVARGARRRARAEP